MPETESTPVPTNKEIIPVTVLRSQLPETIPEFETIPDDTQSQIDSNTRKSFDSDRTVSPSTLNEILFGNLICKTPEPLEDSESAKHKNITLSRTVTPLLHNASPYDIRRIPKMESKTTRKRKSQRAEILTSTPIKDQHREKEMKKTITKKKGDAVKEHLKEVTSGSNKKWALKRNSKDVKPSTSNINKDGKRMKKGIKQSECRCLVCYEQYQDPPLEDWIRCDDCNMWAHGSCTSYSGRGAYYCDLCQE